MKHYKIAVAIFIASTLIALVSTTIYVAALFTWNPPPETNYVPIVISYPDSMFMPMYGDNATICTIKFLLEFNGTISENTQIKIINATCWSYVPYNIIVYVGFPQAIPYDLKTTIGDNSTFIMGWGGSDVLIFHDNFTETDSPFKPVANYHGIYPIYPHEIYFPVAGDYSPIIMLAKQGQEYNPIIYRYDQIQVHVATATEIEGLKLNTQNLGLTVALFVFSWIGELVLIYELASKMLTKENGQIAININIVPNTNNAIPVSKTEKATNFSKSPEPDKLNKESQKETTNNNPNQSNASPN